ncbi:P-loop containing nucleoside triphosphate hydrolase protein [Ascodesmis nigricans]|uniref:P-loop containing nucleoside triphosphate hydrolase protein n=1 Tax=Ascodesmis nigricans TaxID=341454 RepID=A0A4S2N221_9PEZI|nr:P-loop containing nucleoside triphosphate hydrolase protein [Ascodesmis nigricans]
MSSQPLRQKLVIIGDGNRGKTSLLFRFTQNIFDSHNHVQHVFDGFITDLTLSDGTLIELGLWDSRDQVDDDRLRPLMYPRSDVVVVSFGVDSPGFLENVYEKWVDEVRQICGDVPVILVALKADS